MHYRNGQEAHVGDVIEFLDYQKVRHLGILTQVSPGSKTCNAMADKLLSGIKSPTGFVLISRHYESTSVTLGECDLVIRLSESRDPLGS